MLPHSVCVRWWSQLAASEAKGSNVQSVCWHSSCSRSDRATPSPVQRAATCLPLLEAQGQSANLLMAGVRFPGSHPPSA